MEGYPYQPLDSKVGQIRLLHLLPKRTDSTTTRGRSDQVWINTTADHSAYVLFNESIDKLKANDGQSGNQSESVQTCLGRLETVALENEPRYTALSYVWGDSSDRVPCVLDNHRLLITRNLTLALQALQLDDEPFVLWIDALCINQNDLKEKSEQVLRMKEIYASASLVVVWLGAATPATDVAVDMFNAYYEKGPSLELTARHTYRFRDEQRQELIEDPQFKNFIESDSIPSLLIVIRFLLVREWWFRAWVLQEFCVGQEVYFACGNKKLRLAIFDNTIMSFKTFFNIWSAHVLYTPEQWLTTSNKDKSRRLSKTEGSPEVEHAMNFLKQRLYHQHSLEEQKNRSLLDLLVTFYVNVPPRSQLRSTDPRDKIYSLLGIASDAEKLKIVPDYSKSVEEVYTDAAAKILSLGKLELLHYVHPQNPNMPSWVPDWERAKRHITPYEFRELDKPFSADATMAAFQSGQPPGDQSVLECHGCIVDSISSFSDFLTDDTTKALLALAEMPSNKETRVEFDVLIKFHVHLSQIKQLCQRSALFNPSLYGSSDTWLKEALWRIPVNDQEMIDAHFTRYQRATSESECRYNGLLNTIEAWKSIGVRLGGPDPRPLPAFLQNDVLPIVQRESRHYALYRPAIMRTVSRRPYLTQKGYVGLGHEGMRVGDLVCILQGGPVPFLLRRTETGEYVLIRDTYVHGIMDGEFMKTKPEMETFRIV